MKSTLAAEALIFDEAIGHALYFQAVFREIVNVEIKLISYTDSADLVESINNYREVDDKQLRIDIAKIKQSIQNNGIDAYHVPGNKMIANCLTKKGASCES